MSDSSNGRNSLRVAAAQGTSWTLLDKWGVRLCSFATFAILSRLVGPEAFGTVAAAQVVVVLLQTASGQGLIQTLVVAPSFDSPTRKTAATVALCAGLITAAAICLVSLGLHKAIDDPQLPAVLATLSLCLVAQSFGVVATATLQRQLQFERLAIRSLIATFLSAVIGVGTAVSGWGVWALVAQALVQSVVLAILSCLAIGAWPRFGWSKGAFRKLIVVAGPIMIADILVVAVSQGDNLVVGIVLGTVALGYYAVAFRLLNVVVDVFTGVLTSVALPIFARLAGDPDALRSAYLRATKMSFAVSLPVYLALVISAPSIVPMLFGSQWSPSVQLFQVLCLAGIIMSATYFDRPLLLTRGRARLELLITLIIAVATLLAALLGSLVSLFGAAVAVTVKMYVAWPIRYFAISTVAGLRLDQYARIFLRPGLAGLLQFASAVLLITAVPGTSDASRLAVAGTSVLVYGVVILLIDRPVVLEAKALLRSLAPR